MNASPPDETQMSALLRGIDIPPRPAVLEELDAELRRTDPDQRTIARLISRDVALSGLVMQVANSPAFFTGREVNSIIHALTVLGMRQMFNLVVTQLLKVALAGKPEVPMDRFWDSSAATARVAAELARRLGCAKPEMAYTFSLFHDCGIPLMMKRFPDYRAVLAEANAADSKAFTAVEEARLGTNHAVVGYFLARRWKLPEYVAQGILVHHDYEALDGGASEVKTESQAMVALNALAEHIARLHASRGEREENEWSKAADPVGAFLGLSADNLTDLVEDVLDWLESQ